ncbi:Down syndrome cell adhesion molecule-like protein Dscam2 [Halotydeus destructor]|nr:Down syndrome cell adhesion molecule-like protein Dscam2 [Halotydeus destructor]
MKQNFTIQTSDEFATIGNSLSLFCNIPEFVRNFVQVTHWQRSDGLVYGAPSQGHIRLIEGGTLFFESVQRQDFMWKFRCFGRDQLNGQTVSSVTWAKLIRSDSESKTRTSPRIVDPNRAEYIVEAGSDVHLGCSAQAFPVPSYSWHRSTTVASLSSSTSQGQKTNFRQPQGPDISPLGSLLVRRSVLSILNVQAKDAAIYVCLANNSLGEDRKWIKITVIDKLLVDVRLGVNHERATASLECFVNSDSHHVLDEYPYRVSFEWFKDGKPLGTMPSSSFSRIRRISPNKPPELQETFNSRTIHADQSLNLKCSARGSPLPQIRWYYYGNPLLTLQHHNMNRYNYRIADYVDEKGTIVSHFNISNVSVLDGGQYSCQGFNDIGHSRRHSATVHIVGPLSVKAMDNVTVVTSENLWLDCPVSGFPIQSIRWSIVGKDLSTMRRVKSFENGTLAVIDAHSQDEGWYRCDSRNQDNQLASGSLYIHVVEKPVINPFLFGSDLREGMRTTVMCSVLSGDSPLSITWYKDGVELKSVHSEVEIISLGEFTSTLRIPIVLRSHAGNYTCSARLARVTTNFTTEMVVHAPPNWVFKPKEEYSALKGRRVLIDCQAEGVPQPVHHWKRRTRKNFYSNDLNTSDYIGIVSGPHIHVLENGSLAIVDVDKTDEGEYLCESSNAIGSALSTKVTLNVPLPPYFKRSFQVVKAVQDKSVTLLCEVTGEAVIKLQWFRDNVMLSDTYDTNQKYITETVNGLDGTLVSSRLTLLFVHVTDSNLYTCKARNDYGAEEMNIQLIVEGPPSPPFYVNVIESQSRQVTIAWSEATDGNSPIIAYLVECRPINGSWTSNYEAMSVPAKETSLTMTGLQPFTQYVVRLVSTNSIGKSRPSEEKVFHTDEEAPNQVPSNVRGSAISSTSIRIQWKYPMVRTSSFADGTHKPVVRSEKGTLNGFYVGFKAALDGDISAASGASRASSSTNAFTFKTVELESNKKASSSGDSYEISVNDLQRNGRYVVIVQAFNKKGPGPSSPEIVVQTSEYDAPSSITVKVSTVDNHSLKLFFEDNVGRGGVAEPVTGYLISYKTQLDHWEEQRVLGKHLVYLLDNLRCGTSYDIKVAPFNSVGQAEWTQIATAATSGSVATAPPTKSLFVTNSTFILVNLSAWLDNGCSIAYFVIQYKEHYLPDWLLLSNNVIPEQSNIIVSDLSPATYYDILIAAHSEAGSSEAQYVVSTLTINGATIAPISISAVNSSWEVYDPVVLAPIVCATIVVFAILVTVWYIVTSNRNHDQSHFHQAPEVDLYSTMCPQKMDSLSVASHGRMEQCENNKGIKMYDVLHRDAGYSSCYSSPYVTNNRNQPLGPPLTTCKAKFPLYGRQCDGMAVPTEHHQPESMGNVAYGFASQSGEYQILFSTRNNRDSIGTISEENIDLYKTSENC